jgi:beta-phosphoglucomutase-like phosphatase (HAD superfamily)/GNAT superfamily N-acetyltransferase
VSRAVIFDFDGTIVDTETTLFQAYSEVFTAHGHELDRDRWLSIIGTDNGWDPMEDLATLVGEPLPDAVHDARRARRDELIEHAGVRAGVLQWLDDADRFGIPVGIASSSPIDWVERHLDRLGLLERFACFACCNEIIPAKPDPTSYRLACEALDARPERSIAVEDSPHGVAAAKDAGLFTVAVPHGLTATLDLSRADIVTESLADVRLADLVVELRPADADEGDWLYALHEAAMRERVVQVYGAWDDAFQRERFRPADDVRGSEVIEVDGERIGAVHTSTDDDGALRIDLLEVLPEYQGAGAGGAVLRRLVERAGARDVALQTHHGNPAVRLYERVGFARVGETDTHLLFRHRT